MKLSYKKIILITAFLTLGCGNKPTKKTNRDKILQQDAATVALWTVTGDTTSQKISRFDLARGGEEKKTIEAPSTDTALSGDSSQLFVLSRSGTYSISRFIDAVGTLKDETKLTELEKKFPNAQEVLVDPKGKIWVTDQNSNFVRVFENGLDTPPKTVDLTSLAADEADQLAELKPLALTVDGYVVVGGQMLQQNSGWAIQDYSRIAWIDLNTLAVVHTETVPTPNLNKIIPMSAGKLVLVGSGLQKPGGSDGTTLELNYDVKDGKFTVTPASPVSQEGKVMDVAYSSVTKKLYYLISEDKEAKEQRYCVHSDGKNIVCDTAWLSTILIHKDRAYVGKAGVGETGKNNSEVWVLDLSVENPKLLQKISLSAHLYSLSFGP